jgi:hypothetical protein
MYVRFQSQLIATEGAFNVDRGLMEHISYHIFWMVLLQYNLTYFHFYH